MGAVRSVVAAVITVLLAGCGGDGATGAGEPKLASLTISPSSDTVESIGASVLLTATALDSRGAAIPGVSITWSSSNPAVAEVQPSGMVVGRAAGVTDIVASAGTVSSTARVTVLGPSAVVISAAQRGNVNFGSEIINVSVRNTGARGVYKLEFWGLRTSPSGPDRLFATSEPIEVGPTYSETLSYNVPSGTTGTTGRVAWIIAYTRDVGSATYRQTSRFDF